jgi:transposase
MLKKEDFVVIQALVKRGVYQKDIAQELGVHRKTVRRALQRGGAPERRQKRSSKLDPYKAQVDELLDQGVWNAVVILRELEEAGYTGKGSILRDYIRPKRAWRSGKATVRFETAPGRQLQSDWGAVRTLLGGVETKVHFIVNELGYSRRFHFWCTDSEDAEHTYEGLIASFEHFGGVPSEVLVDNQKAAVLDWSGGRAHFQGRFLDLAGHYGFTPRACRPYRARTKGKDERMVGYIKGHFFVRYRAFDSWAHLNQVAERWLAGEADQRVHGTVHEVVAERFAGEAPHLGSLPVARYDTSYRETRHVSWDGYVEVRGNRYSVPHGLQGRELAVRIGLDGQLRVFDGEQLVASHRLRAASEGWVTVPAHHAALWQATLGVQRRELDVYEEASTWS